MSNATIYLDALMQFDRPASVREVHEKAIEMFGSAVRGDRNSARACLERYLITGKVTKQDARYYATSEAVDPVGKLGTQLKEQAATIERQAREIESLRKQIEELRA